MSLAREIRQSSRLEGDFVLRSGRPGTIYFDKYRFEADPRLLLAVATEMSSLVPARAEVLAGLEMGGIPLVAVLSQILGIPAAFIRKEAKGYGTCSRVEGANLAGRRFILVEDVVSSGGSIVSAVEKLREDGLQVDLAICVIDRQTGGKEKLQSIGVQLSSLFTFDDIENA